MLCVSVWAFALVAGVTEETEAAILFMCTAWCGSVCVIQHQAVAELSVCVQEPQERSSACKVSVPQYVCTESIVKRPSVKALGVLARDHQVSSSE